MRYPSLLPALALALAVRADPASACAFHNYLPEQTLVDRLLATENVVLARPNPEDPFRFQAVEALEGTMAQADLPTLVDSTTRRKLALNPDDTVLFARDDGAYGPFLRLAYLDPAHRDVVETIMAHKENWIMGDDLGRYQYFADLLQHPDPAIHALALRELDTAPYDLLRSLSLTPNPDRILKSLWIPSEMPYQPIRILLLGFTQGEHAQTTLSAGLERSRKSGATTNLGPYATAVVERDGIAGVTRLVEMFLADTPAPADQVELVVEALAIHAGAAAPERRAEILTTLANVLSSHPEHAGAVARQFQFRYDFGMGDALAQVLESGQIRSANAAIPVSTYVMLARQDQSFATETE
ncbi:hypothetical protein [Tropicimonas marinistellae]|uniref:hypothetical protein n=1 Tax=Tropicimonas marinistellae TaxID=1739787 RepID=UPI000829A9E8|nr:hypothetical protein [Tropicimonas marinistellae]